MPQICMHENCQVSSRPRSTLKLRQYFPIRGDKNLANSRGRNPSVLQHPESSEITYIKRTAIILMNKENVEGVLLITRVPSSC